MTGSRLADGRKELSENEHVVWIEVRGFYFPAM